MAKKFVRGITDIKNIEHQDFDTNNVNDLLSDGEHSYIHRKKKDGTEEYHNLTNNLKTIEAFDNGLLTVRNYNNTTNSSKLTVHHDSQKSQKLASTYHTINVLNGDNGTGEFTTVDVNPEKVLEHDNLLTDYGISKTTTGEQTTLGIGYTQVAFNYDLNTLRNGRVKASGFTNAPKNSTWFLVSSFSEGEFTIQEAIELIDPKNTVYKRTKQNGVWGEWREQVSDKSVINELLAPSVTVYTHENATLKLFKRPTGDDNLEFKFFICIKKGQTSAEFMMSDQDLDYMYYIIQNFGQEGRINIQGSSIQIYPNATRIYFSSQGSQFNPHFINFFDIIPINVPSNRTEQQAPASSQLQKGDSLTVDKVEEIVEKTDEIVDTLE